MSSRRGTSSTRHAWQLYPGTYVVTIHGSDLDHSYIHSGYQNTDAQWTEQDIVFLTGEPEEMVFQFTVGEPVIGWSVQIHTLDDTPLTVTGIEVSPAA